MQLITLIKHKKISGAGASATTTITTTAHIDDDGPFIDLEFTNNDDEVEQNSSSDDEELGFIDPLFSISPSDDLFYKGRSISIEPSSATTNQKAHSFRLKFNAFKLKLRRKSKNSTITAGAGETPEVRRRNKLLIKLKSDDVPLSSLFTRENSTRSSISSRSTRISTDVERLSPASDERRLSRDSIHSYMSSMYCRISRRYGEKVRFSDQLRSTVDGEVRPAGDAVGFETEKLHRSKFPAGLKVMYRRFRKSRSASVASVRSPTMFRSESRRDDSLLEQEDGIQSAIAHCKRSLDRACRSPLIRSRSDPGEGLKNECIATKV